MDAVAANFCTAEEYDVDTRIILEIDLERGSKYTIHQDNPGVFVYYANSESWYCLLGNYGYKRWVTARATERTR